MKYIVFVTVLIFAFLFATCGDVERTNPLDPKNPNSKANRVVLVEAFVNSTAGAPVENALNGLARLYQNFSSNNFIILEHHIEKTANTDPDASPESLNRYQQLVSANTDQAIPDVFFDGLAGRVQGASSEATALNRYKIELENQVYASSYFLIETEQSFSGNQFATSITVARLGSQDSDDFLIQLAVVEFKNGRNVVRHFSAIKAVNSLKAGETVTANKTITLNNGWNKQNLTLVIFIQDSRTKRVQQTAVVED